ncbi:hypothetical protein DN603_09505 [Raoultella planticola]|uniref:Uncharacterized protein n=1 Tax=Raoultella planticola TaxID=575 RepID=A0A443VP57_RAOPL|nr:hypothetical protein [Raoultella planticola]RWT23325.1 hypothetical protein DN603_09505 [Raoultella planticola]
MNGALKNQKLLTVWELLKAVAECRASFTSLRLTTEIKTNSPKLREVIISDFDRQKGELFFIVDGSCREITEIKDNLRVTLTGVDKVNGIQLKVEGVSEIVKDYSVLKKHRSKIRSLSSCGHFEIPVISCVELTSPEIVHVLHCGDGITQEPIGNYSLIHVRIERIDWIEFLSSPRLIYQYVKIAGEWISYQVTT